MCSFDGSFDGYFELSSGCLSVCLFKMGLSHLNHTTRPSLSSLSLELTLGFGSAGVSVLGKGFSYPTDRLSRAWGGRRSTTQCTRGRCALARVHAYLCPHARRRADTQTRGWAGGRAGGQVGRRVHTRMLVRARAGGSDGGRRLRFERRAGPRRGPGGRPTCSRARWPWPRPWARADRLPRASGTFLARPWGSRRHPCYGESLDRQCH